MHHFAETSPVATVLLLSELQQSAHAPAVHALAASFPDNLYLVSEQWAIPVFYYQIPSVALACEQALAQAEEALFATGARLGLAPARCLLVLRYSPSFSKTRLQRQLVRRLKCPVRLLTMAGNEPWLYTLGLASTKLAQNRARRQNKAADKVEGSVRISSLTSSVLH